MIELFGAWSSEDNRLGNRGGSTMWKPTAEEMPVLIKAQESVRSVSEFGRERKNTGSEESSRRRA